MKLFNKLTLVSIALLANVISAQPIASADKLGVEVRYMIEIGGMAGLTAGDFKGDAVEVPEMNEGNISGGLLGLPDLNKHAGLVFGIGAQIDRLHEISFQYSDLKSQDKEKFDVFWLKIHYRYLFLKSMKWKPFVGGGFHYSKLTLKDGFVTSDRGIEYSADGAGRGLQFDAGYGGFYRHIGWVVGVGYSFSSYDAFAVEDDGFDLNPGANLNQFYLFSTLRLYY